MNEWEVWLEISNKILYKLKITARFWLSILQVVFVNEKSFQIETSGHSARGSENHCEKPLMSNFADACTPTWRGNLRYNTLSSVSKSFPGGFLGDRRVRLIVTSAWFIAGIMQRQASEWIRIVEQRVPNIGVHMRYSCLPVDVSRVFFFFYSFDAHVWIAFAAAGNLGHK